MHTRTPFTMSLALLPALCATAWADGPLEGLPITFVTDPGSGQVYRLIDADGDGSWDQPGDAAVFYDSAEPGANVALSDPIHLTLSPNDFLYIADRGLGVIVAMEDLDNDGDCHDVVNTLSENFIYFNGTAGTVQGVAANASGVRMDRPYGVTNRFLGVIWVTSSYSTIGSAGQVASIVRLEDKNSDRDANDTGEAFEYYAIPGAAIGDSDPRGIVNDGNGALYYLENGAVTGKGLYRVRDDDRSGSIDQPGEVSLLWAPTGAGSVTLNGLVRVEDELTGDVRFYVSGFDAAGDNVIWALDDVGGDDTIDAGAEFWNEGPSGGVLHLADFGLAGEGDFDGVLGLRSGGALQNQVVLFEEDGVGGVADEELFDDAISPLTMDTPSGIAVDFHGHQVVGRPFCLGLSCPCGNDAFPASQGCANSSGPGVGVALEGEGTASVSLDDLEVEAENLPPFQPVLLFSGTSAVNGGLGVPFGDGLRCAGGSVVRLGVEIADAKGEAVWENLVAAGGYNAGDTRYLQAWYRDPAGPCGSGFNTSNGLEISFTQ